MQSRAKGFILARFFKVLISMALVFGLMPFYETEVKAEGEVSVTITLENAKQCNANGELISPETSTISFAAAPGTALANPYYAKADEGYALPVPAELANTGLTYAYDSDTKIATISGTLKSDATGSVTDTITAVKNPYHISITLSHATAAGKLEQDVSASQAMSNVTVTADEGYYLPDAAAGNLNGLTYTAATGVISGTPTADTSIAITAIAKQKKQHQQQLQHLQKRTW